MTWLVFIDDLHLRFTDTGRVRDALRTTLDTLVRDGDRVVMWSDGPSSIRVDLTGLDVHADGLRLREAVKRVAGNGLKPEDMLPRSRQSVREVRYRAAVALETLRGLVDASLPIDGPVAIVYVSHGYLDGVLDVAAVAEQAARIGGTVFPLDNRAAPRDPSDPFWGATRGSLQELATATGGTWQDTGEDLRTFLGRIGAAVRP